MPDVILTHLQKAANDFERMVDSVKQAAARNGQIVDEGAMDDIAGSVRILTVVWETELKKVWLISSRIQWR